MAAEWTVVNLLILGLILGGAVALVAAVLSIFRRLRAVEARLDALTKGQGDRRE